MAIKMNPKGISTFKANLEKLVPYQDPDLLNILVKSLYTSSNYHFEVMSGLQSAVAINQVQMYSRHNVEEECAILCSSLPLPKFYRHLSSQDTIDEIEFAAYPKRRALRQAAYTQFEQECAHNEQRLDAVRDPVPVDTSYFPKIARSLNLTCAADQAFAFDHEEPLIVTVYGIAAGHVVEYMHKIYPQLEINVILLNPEITAIMLCLDDKMGQRLSSPQVHLYLASDDTPILPNHIFLAPEVTLSPYINSRLKQRILHYQEKNYNRLHSLVRRKTISNLIARYTWPYCLKARQLKNNTFSPIQEIALVFSGPSLNDSLQRLIDLKNSGVRIIACDTALPFLESVNLAPDIVVISELGIYKMAGAGCLMQPPQLFKNRELYKNSALIFSSKTHLRLVALFSGKKYLLYTKDLAHRKVPEQDNALTDFDVSSGNTSIMVSLALKQQARRIYLFGLDTVPRLGSYHAGFDQEQEVKLCTVLKTEEVECNDGRTRNALHSYSAIRIYMEEVIENHRDIDFVNCSPFGAIIRGCSLDFFSERTPYQD